MIERTRVSSPRLVARIAGVLYLLIFLSAPRGAATATPAKMIVNLACDTGVAILLYELLKPVSRPLSLVAALFRLLFVTVMAANSLNYFGAANLFHRAHSPAAFNFGYAVALVPFGVHCLLIGYLIFNSIFIPRTLGVLMAVAGFGYLTFLWPPLGSRLFFPYIVIPGVVGEGLLTLWLIVIGVNSQRWRDQASAAHLSDTTYPQDGRRRNTSSIGQAGS
jgi:hypothetical protein